MNGCKFRETDRTGLYFMVFLTMISSCNVENMCRKMRSDIIKIDNEISYHSMVANTNAAVEVELESSEENDGKQ